MPKETEAKLDFWEVYGRGGVGVGGQIKESYTLYVKSMDMIWNHTTRKSQKSRICAERM